MSDQKRFLKILEDIAYSGSVADFNRAFDKFSHNPQALAALVRGVDRLEKNVDSGSYCESPSRNYDEWCKKSNKIDSFVKNADKDFFDNFDVNDLEETRPVRDTNKLSRDFEKALLGQISNIAKRLDQIEEAIDQSPPEKREAIKFRLRKSS